MTNRFVVKSTIVLTGEPTSVARAEEALIETLASPRWKTELQRQLDVNDSTTGVTLERVSTERGSVTLVAIFTVVLDTINILANIDGTISLVQKLVSSDLTQRVELIARDNGVILKQPIKVSSAILETENRKPASRISGALLIALSSLFGFGLAVIGFFILLQTGVVRLPLQSAPVTAQAALPQNIEEPSTDFVTPLATRPEDSPAINQTETVAITVAPSHTSTRAPTDTPPPTSTTSPEPTDTKQPQPTATPDTSILFQDNFDSGLSSLWQLVYGHPIVVNEALTADEETWLSIGDTSWTNYKIEFEADAADCWLSWSINVVAVHLTNVDNYLAFVWADCENYWFTYDGEWNQIPHTDGGTTGYAKIKVSIVVNGAEFVAYSQGERLSSLINNDFPSGGVGLRIAAETIIDDFKVTRIDP